MTGWMYGCLKTLRSFPNHKTGFTLHPPPQPTPRGAAAQRGPWPPHSWGLWITHNDASHSVGLLWTSDQLVAETSTSQKTQHSQHTNIHAHGGIRTHDLSRRAAADLRLRTRGHRHRRFTLPILKKKNTQTEDMKTVVLKHMGQFYRVSIKSFPDYKLYYKKTTVRGIQTYFF